MPKQFNNSDITRWTFAGLQREESGRFRDADLAHILQDGTANPAGAFEARGTPAALRTFDVMTIHQARAWGCTVGVPHLGCSRTDEPQLNEFRISLGLKREYVMVLLHQGLTPPSIYILPRVEPKEGNLG